MIKELQHMPDVLRVLYHEVQLHIEFAAHELHRKMEVCYDEECTIADA
jgi:hypothetical protein